MKNIHVLQTDKRSRLWTNNLRRRLELDEFPEQHPTNIAKHIYITSDEEIKEGNWVFNETSKEVYKITNVDELVIYEKKIILTTDPDLIKDGVQAIDDEFLEWFVKNPSCESVDVIYDKDTFPYGVETAKGYGWYKIIIPREELKCTCKEHDPYCCQVHGTCPTCVKQQELKQFSMTEAAKETTKKYINEREKQTAYLEFIAGAKWKEERMYSEDKVIILLNKFGQKVYGDYTRNQTMEDFTEEWFEQHKKK
jgi:hypothetical protein